VSPTGNVWIDGGERGLTDAFDAVERYVRENGNNRGQRALLLPHGSVRRES
jgi:hypothetical protein